MTTDNGTTVGQEFLRSQVELLEAGDTANLSMRYAPDAVFVRFDVVARGRDEIKAMFDHYLTQQPEVGEIAGVQIIDDIILYQASERLKGKLIWAVGTLIFEDGLVKRQTATFVDRPFES